MNYYGSAIPPKIMEKFTYLTSRKRFNELAHEGMRTIDQAAREMGHLEAALSLKRGVRQEEAPKVDDSKHEVRGDHLEDGVGAGEQAIVTNPPATTVEVNTEARDRTDDAASTDALVRGGVGMYATLRPKQ